MKISVIIPVYNGVKTLARCLESLMFPLPDQAEVFVIDNGSTDGSAAIAERFGGVRLIRNARNLGAAKARNQGIASSSGSWILTLDCDTALRPDFFTALMRVLEYADDRLGMMQPKILDRKDGMIFSTGIQLTKLRRFYDRGQGRKDAGQFDRKIRIFGACSAAAVYRRRMLDDIKDAYGYFDERFFFLVEDVDLAWRAQRRGWKALFLPQAVCHHEGNSSKTDHRVRQYLCFRNRRLMMGKNEGWAGKIRQFVLSPFYDVPRIVYMSVTNPYLFDPPRF